MGKGLDLRPSELSSDAGHPDASARPSWCLYGADEGHGVDGWHGGDVEHVGESVTSRASPYQGRYADGLAKFAALDAHLEQDGSGPPRVSVDLRHYKYPGPEQVYQEVLRLTVQDAA